MTPPTITLLTMEEKQHRCDAGVYMDFRGSARVAITAAAVTGLEGLALLAWGILRAALPAAVGGSCLTLCAMIGFSLVLIRSWVVDTRDVRQALAAAQRQAQARADTYLAAQAALENEQARLNRDMAEERRRIAATLIREREAMEAEFEERRATVIAESIEAAFHMFHNGKFAPDTSSTGRLIRFPRQEHQSAATPQPERSREHGVVGP